MRTAIWLGIFGVLGAAAVTACGNGGTTGTGETMSSGGGGKAGSGGSTMEVNGCELATAEDHTADATTMIAFGGALGTTYAPACIKIKKGNSVTWTGDFASHPLSGGLDGTTDATSPIAVTSTGMTTTVMFPASGTFGYFCENHFNIGMEGAVFVE